MMGYPALGIGNKKEAADCASFYHFYFYFKTPHSPASAEMRSHHGYLSYQ
jgi:hypothetical protein